MSWRHVFLGAGVGGVVGCAPLLAWSVLPQGHPVSSFLTKSIAPHIAEHNHQVWKAGLERPKRIILLRHGQTHGYSHTCDCQVAGLPVCAMKPEYARPLTEEGKLQSVQAGVALKQILKNEKVVFYTSPYLSCRQTVQYITASFKEHRSQYVEDPRLRNIDHGNWHLDTPAETLEQYRKESEEIGRFYYRWPGGESCGDVYDRVCGLLETIYRKWQVPGRPENYVMITHSVVAQVFLMRWFHWDVETFKRLKKFKNGQLVIMEKQTDGSYKLITPLPADPPMPQGVKYLASSLDSPEDEAAGSESR